MSSYSKKWEYFVYESGYCWCSVAHNILYIYVDIYIYMYFYTYIYYFFFIYIIRLEVIAINNFAAITFSQLLLLLILMKHWFYTRNDYEDTVVATSQFLNMHDIFKSFKNLFTTQMTQNCLRTSIFDIFNNQFTMNKQLKRVFIIFIIIIINIIIIIIIIFFYNKHFIFKSFSFYFFLYNFYIYDLWITWKILCLIESVVLNSRNNT